jgi:hypothetical protein
MTKVYGFTRGLFELSKLYFGIKNKEEIKMVDLSLTRKDLVDRLRDYAEVNNLDKASTICNFFNYESKYLYRHNSYINHSVQEDSAKAFNVYIRYMDIKRNKL